MNRLIIGVVVVGAGVLLSSLVPVAGAQAQPVPQPSPPANTQPNPPAAQPNRYGEHDPYGTINTTTGAAGSTDFPAAFVAVVPEAKARAAAANAMYDRAGSDLGITIRRLHSELEHTSEMQNAIEEARAAYEDYQAARAKALLPVSTSEEVQAVQSLRKDISRQIENQRASSQPDEKQVVALATLKMEVSAQVREKEILALASDPAVVQARARYMLAARKLSELRERNSDQVRNHPDVLAARRALDDARVIRLASAAYLDGTIRAANVALDYAYNLHRWDYYRYGAFGGYYGGYPYYSSTGYYDPFYATRRY